jgi:hypothetical protein
MADYEMHDLIPGISTEVNLQFVQYVYGDQNVSNLRCNFLPSSLKPIVISHFLFLLFCGDRDFCVANRPFCFKV